MRTILLLLVLTAALFSCTTIPSEIPQDLQPKEFFQRAQEAVVEHNDYHTALFYYEAFLQRFGSELQLAIEAEYEIAFIHYKLGEYDTARKEFDALLEKYKADSAQIYPRWPLVLTRIVLARMDASSTSTPIAAE